LRFLQEPALTSSKGRVRCCLYHEISAESKPVLYTVSQPALRKVREERGLIVSARSEAWPPTMNMRVGFVVAHPSDCDGWGIRFCGGIGSASARVGQPTLRGDRRRLTHSMILGFAGPVSSALPRGQDNGHYDQHGKQAYVGKNAAAGCRRPSEQDEPKNAARNRDQPQKHPPPFLAHGMAPPMPALRVTSAPPGIVERFA
jgi:hypothetical protein